MTNLFIDSCAKKKKRKGTSEMIATNRIFDSKTTLPHNTETPKIEHHEQLKSTPSFILYTYTSS